jgi:hypothetical protein
MDAWSIRPGSEDHVLEPAESRCCHVRRAVCLLSRGQARMRRGMHVVSCRAVALVFQAVAGKIYREAIDGSPTFSALLWLLWPC